MPSLRKLTLIFGMIAMALLALAGCQVGRRLFKILLHLLLSFG